MGHVNVRWHLRHEVDATLGMGVGLVTFAGAYVVKLTLYVAFAGTYVMKFMLCWGWGWGWVGHVNVRWRLR